MCSSDLEGLEKEFKHLLKDKSDWSKLAKNILYSKSLKQLQSDLPKINLDIADKNRNGLYSTGLSQLEDLLKGNLTIEDIFHDPDNELRNLSMLTFLDAKDNSTKK